LPPRAIVLEPRQVYKDEHGRPSIFLACAMLTGGPQYVVRHYKSGIDAGFIAHPSLVQEHELQAITGPLSIAAAENDNIFPAEMRHTSEDILVKTGQRYQINLYGGVEHGFAVRRNVDVPVETFARDQAFRQAVAWFDEWLS